MPRVSVYTNVSASTVDSSALLKELNTASARSIGKDASKFMTLFHPDQKVHFCDSEDPAAFVEVASIGYIGGDKNADISSALTEVIGKFLSVPPERVYINFFDIAASDWGVAGTTSAMMTKN